MEGGKGGESSDNGRGMRGGEKEKTKTMEGKGE